VTRRRLFAILRGSVLAAACWYLGVYLVLAWLRLPYPFELEWMEGGSVHHVARVLEGRALYVAPGLEFIPYNYPPLYYSVSAVLARFTGIGFFPLRAVSFASSLLCFLTIYALVRAETDGELPAVAATGLFAATYRIGGTWLDVARVDSLFLGLFLLALLVLRRGHSTGASLLAGLLFGLSFLAKQTALAMCVPVIVWLFVQAPRRAACVAGGLVTVVGLSTAALHWASDGWYSFWVFRVPFLHAWVRPVFVTFWTQDLFGRLPLASILAAVFLAGPLRSRSDLFWLAAAVGMVGGAYRSRVQIGGYDNVLLPAYAILSILCGLGLALFRATPGSAGGERPAWHIGMWAACLVQLIGLAYDPRTAVPTPADTRAGEQVLGTVRGVPGEVFVPYHGYLAALAGKRPYAHIMTVVDVLKLQLPMSEALAEEHRAAFRERRFGAVLLDDRESYVFIRELEASYVLDRELLTDPAAFFPVTGVRTRPLSLYVPRSP
jgi:4-amino-4-deoxy-L-arabinose transferase-like glycosyltransferase